MAKPKERYAKIEPTVAQSASEKAKDLLDQGGLMPDPVNYMVAYEYSLGKNQDLIREMDHRLERGQRWDDGLMAALFERLIESQRDDQYAGMSEELTKMIANIIGKVRETNASVGDYQKVLAQQHRGLNGAVTKEDLTAIVKDLMSATRQVATSSGALQEQLSSTQSEVETLRQQLAEVKREAEFDALTGSLNRKALERTLDRLMAEANAGGKTFCLLVADVDHFKHFNDSYGHLLGDEVLRRVVQSMHQQVRGGDYVARYGGEEFMVMLPETPLIGGLKVAESIRHAVEQIVLIRRSTHEKLSKVTISLGVGEYRQGEEKLELVERVDAALYKAKHGGRNRVEASD